MQSSSPLFGPPTSKHNKGDFIGFVWAQDEAVANCAQTGLSWTGPATPKSHPLYISIIHFIFRVRVLRCGSFSLLFISKLSDPRQRRRTSRSHHGVRGRHSLTLDHLRYTIANMSLLSISYDIFLYIFAYFLFTSNVVSHDLKKDGSCEIVASKSRDS